MKHSNSIHKAKRNMYYQKQKAKWNKIHTVVDVIINGFGDPEGYDKKGNFYSHLTNFNVRDLPLFKEAVRTYGGPDIFAIGTETWGCSEDSGPWKIHDEDMYAFYTRSREDMSTFWAHYDNLRNKYRRHSWH